MAKVQFVTPENAARIEAPAWDAGRSNRRRISRSKPIRFIAGPSADRGCGVECQEVCATDTLVYVWTGAVVVHGVRLASDRV